MSAAGIGLVSVFEFDSKDATGGYHQGKEYAALAHEQHTAAGGPSGRPIYFGVDFDTPDYAAQLPNTPEHALAKLGPIGEYFKGCNDVLGSHLTGAYGGYWVIKRLFEANMISFGWQTVAWSGGQRYPRAALYQTDFHGSYDVNFCDASDFGQWRIGWRPRDGPSDVHPVTPTTQVWHKVQPGDTLSGLAARLRHHGAGHRRPQPQPDHRCRSHRGRLEHPGQVAAGCSASCSASRPWFSFRPAARLARHDGQAAAPPVTGRLPVA